MKCCSESNRKSSAPFVTCSRLFDNAMYGKSYKQDEHKFDYGRYKKQDGDETEQKLEVYQEKYLSKKIMAFKWEDAETNMPEKSDLMQKICVRVKNNLSPDLTIRIKDKKFECHSIVLTCYMDLSEEMKCTRKEITLNENRISYETFVEIYHWMLTDQDEAHMKLTRSNVLSMLEAAKYLGVEELEDQCWAFIYSEEIFNEATAFFLYFNAKNISEESREPVMQLMLPRIQTFFLILVSSRNWIELDVKDVCSLLSSDYTRVRCELEIFMSAVRWLLADWSPRKQHVVRVMQCVRFGLMPPFHLVQIRQSSEFTQITSVPGVQKLITEGMDVATVKSTHDLVCSDERQVSQMFGLREPQPRQYLTYDGFLYARLSCIYRDFLFELNQIKEGKINLNEFKTQSVNDSSVNDCSVNDTSVNQCPIRKYSAQFTFLSEFKDKTFTEVQANTKELVNRGKEIVKTNREIPDVSNITNERCLLKRNMNKLTAKENIGTLPTIVQRNLDKIIVDKFTETRKNINNFSEKSTSRAASTIEKNILDRVESSVFMEESEAVLVFGGVDKRASLARQKETGREIHRYNPFVNTWQLVDKMPAARHCQSTIYYEGLVYIAGGIDLTTEEITNSVWSFNPLNKQWKVQSDMIHARKNFNLVACKEKLYAIGGLDKEGVLTNVECYDPVSDIWNEVASLREARMGLAAAEVNGKIWIAGGHNGHALNPLSDKVECYDPVTNSWSSIQPKLRYPRYMATLVHVSNKLYLIGGAAQTDSTNTDKMYSVSDLDVLELAERKEWRCVSDLAQPRHGHSASILSTQILIIGGVTTVYKKPVKSVECWCFKREAWIKGVSALLEPIVGHSSVVLPSKT